MLDQEMTEIAQLIWESVLQLPLESGGTSRGEPAESVTAAIQIGGAWDGMVTVTLNETLGKRIACAMLKVDSSQLGQGDVPEALLEVVNMLAGNLKALLPAPCSLALPHIVASSLESSGTLESTLRFSCLEQPVEIAIRSFPVEAAVEAGDVAC